MLRDEEFSSRAKVDRYGRRLPKDAGRKELQRYYRIAEEDKTEEDEGNEGERDEDDDIEQELERVNAEDEDLSSSEDSSSEEDDLEEDEQEEVFGMLEEHEGGNGTPKGEVSSRIAVVNLDWDNIRAADLMAVFSSFTPTIGRIRKISVYPSEFGKERMEREEMEGPPKEIFARSEINGAAEDHSSSLDKDDSDGDDEEDEREDEDEDERIKKSILKEDKGIEFNSAKLRRYQLERLRYYYAVLDCSSTSTAQAIYDAVDGTEYLTTANFFDLRYIPDETDFSEDKPRDECERIPDGYRPNEFVTDALQHSKVRLTWDADDGTRKEAQKRAFAGSRADIDENDLKAYLGSDSSEDDGPEPVYFDATFEAPVTSEDQANGEEPAPKISKKDAERQRMRALLGLQSEPVPSKKSKAEKTGPVGGLQITFSSGLSSEKSKGSIFENGPEREETTVEKYVRREKERKARRKEKMRGSWNADDVVTNLENATAAPGEELTVEDTAPQDLGFSDPFFVGPTNDKAITTAQRKADKRIKKEQRAADEAATAAERAELELLMVDDKTKDIKHFDMDDIVKAEKARSKNKESKKRLSEREKQALKAVEGDQFKINVGDERFKDVFERSEFSIDPSHPRYKGTEGMRTLLEEGRKKRKGENDGHEGTGDEGEDERREKKKRRREGGEEDDVQRLVAKVKGKSKRL